ncbi:MAG: hypothetical protein EYC70_13520 [Planctomycetota bacterium]|nr:MAG: hypothetical protein EYC70_13520 [Planctomycetota bacterium]
MPIDLQPIPVDARRAARQAVLLRQKIEDAGGIEPAVQAAVDAILAARSVDPASELKRLRLLYQVFYTREELEALVRNTFDSLGLGGRP